MIFDTCLTSGEAGDDRREGVHVGLEDDIVGDAPGLPPRSRHADGLEQTHLEEAFT